MVEYDIQLALTKFQPPLLKELDTRLPEEWELEDASERGYGLLVSQQGSKGSLDERIRDLLKIIGSHVHDLASTQPRVRIGVFSDTATTTVDLDPETLSMMNAAKARLEISFYPCDMS